MVARPRVRAPCGGGASEDCPYPQLVASCVALVVYAAPIYFMDPAVGGKGGWGRLS